MSTIQTDLKIRTVVSRIQTDLKIRTVVSKIQTDLKIRTVVSTIQTDLWIRTVVSQDERSMSAGVPYKKLIFKRNLIFSKINNNNNSKMCLF